MNKPFYITTTLPYVNAEPHIGFALEIVQADIIARWAEMQGTEIFFNTGTDEHGTKIYKKAEEEGRDVQGYVDEYAEKFRSLKEKLGLHPSLHFIRTTDERHIKAAQEMWKRCFDKGDIYKKKYKGLYCVADEAFVREADLVDGKCPNHPTLDLQEIEEENYFFKLSNYKDKLKEYITSGTVVPDWRGEEALSIIDAMDDFSISREKERLPWGVPVPDDESQVMYVWFDALTSYISTLGWPESGDFDKFWAEGETLQLAGKDQVKFQSVIWQSMLMSAGLPNTKKIFYHGFINSGGQKMSKSLGNVISPDDLIKDYGIDALRYYLARHVSTFEDSDVTPESFKEAYNGNLANGIGNLTARIMKLAESNLTGPADISDNEFHGSLKTALENFEIQKAMNHIWQEIAGLDREIQEKKPWESKDKDVIAVLVQKLSHIGHSLAPFMPDTSSKILSAIKANRMPAPLFARKDA
jgi:methionyl-tRNA synthetase